MVYSPREDSYLLEKAVEKFAKGRFLDMGCGSGIQGVAAAKKSCKVTCADIDTEAINATKKVFAEHKLNAEFIVGNLFENIEGKFDCIAFNPPYLPGDKFTDLDGGENGLETTKRFLYEVENHLSKKGVILLIATSLCEQDVKLKKLLMDKGFNVRVEGVERFFFERLYVLKATK